MEFLTTSIKQLQQLWNQRNNVQRAWFIALSLGSIVTIGLVGWWSSRPQFIPLAANLSPGEAAEVVSRLEAAGIRTEMNFAGTSVLVPKKDFGRARTAAGEFAVDVAHDEDSYTGSLLSDPALNRYRVLRAKEQQLESSLMRLKAIKSADVHIAQPEWSPFQRDRAAVTASVVVGVRAGVPFSPQQAATIVATVAGSVEGLSKDNVTVTDLSGRILAGKGMHQGVFSGQLEHQRLVEEGLAARAEDLLTQMLGVGKAAVRVTADIDFTQTERVETIYDPDGEVKKKELITTITSTEPTSLARGVAGIQSNTNVTSHRNTTLAQNSEETSDIEYSHAMTKDTVIITGGDILRLTIAAMVDLTPPEDDPNSPIASLDQGKIESVIKQAVGFDETRGDQIEVLYTSLAATGDPGITLIDTIDRWQFYTVIARHASLGVASLIALALGLLVLRKVRPITVEVETESGIDPEHSKLMADLANHARDNADIVSQIVQAWMEAPSTDRIMPRPHIRSNQSVDVNSA